MTAARKNCLLLAAILLAAALAYADGLNNPFLTDDRYVIFKNFAAWQNWTVREAFDRSLFSSKPSESTYFRPLTLLTFALNYPLAGKNPSGYRAVNLFLHILVVVLMFALLSRLAGSWVAIFAALLYALHPVHVQAISNISARSEPLYTALAILSLLCWHKGNQAQGSRRSFYLASALAAFFLGLFAKESIIVLPPIALLMDLTWTSSRSWREKIKENLPWYFGFAALFGLYLMVRLWLGFFLSMEHGREFGLGYRFLLALKLFALYLGLAFYPAHLSFFHVVPIPQHFFEWEVVLGSMLLVGTVILAWLSWQKRKEISFGLLWFLISILPVLNLTLLNVPMMEHWLYFPFIGLALAFVGGVRALAERTGEARGAALGLILLALFLSARTFTRNFEWSDPLTVFQRDVLLYPGNWRAWGWLGDAMKARGMWDDAIRSYKTSLAIFPHQIETWAALGEALSLADRNEEAEAVLSQAVATRPRDPWFQYVLGLHRLKLGKDRAAIEALEKTLRLNPTPMAYHALGSAYLRLGEKKKAEQAFQKALAMFPGEARFHAGVHVDLGKLYMSQERPKQAREEWQIALRFKPDDEEARRLLENQGNEK